MAFALKAPGSAGAFSLGENPFGRVRIFIFSAFFVILMSSRAFSLPVVETTFILPPEELELALALEVLSLDNDYRKEHVTFGFPLLSDMSLWLTMQTIHLWDGPLEGQPGDALLRLRYHCFYYDVWNYDMAFQLSANIPTGPDSYGGRKFREVNFGNNELSVTAIGRFSPWKRTSFHMNGSYTFRQGYGEGFYGGLRLNPAEKVTYSSLFGLNCRHKEAFLYYERMNNDLLTFSARGSYHGSAGVVVFFEALYSRRINGREAYDELPLIEGPLALLGAVRYFFEEEAYVGLYGGTMLLRDGEKGWRAVLDTTFLF